MWVAIKKCYRKNVIKKVKKNTMTMTINFLRKALKCFRCSFFIYSTNTNSDTSLIKLLLSRIITLQL